MVSDHDRSVLRGLAEQYVALCASDENHKRIGMWRDLNDMKAVRPLVFCNCGLIGEEISEHLPSPQVQADDLKPVECWFQRMLWEASIGDDRVFYPWFTVRAKMLEPEGGVWGVAPKRMQDPISRGWRHMPVIETIEDIEQLKATEHRVLDATPPRAMQLRDIFGDILDVHVDRSTIYPKWGGTDLSEALDTHFGLEELLCAIYTDPEMLHAFMAFTRDGVLQNLKQGESAGDWSTVEHSNYGTPAYCCDFPDPAANTHGTSLQDLCFFTHAQEFEAVSPQHHEEFLLQYQLPIMALFGKVNYGCCETLDHKFALLRKIPNLGKVESGPRSEPSGYPDAFGDTCVISWRPIANLINQPTFDEDAQRKQIRTGLEKLQGSQVEFHMHEPMSVCHDLSRVQRWASIAKEEAEKFGS